MSFLHAFKCTRLFHTVLSQTTARDDVYVRFDSQGLDRELQATALARAEMSSKTPSAKVAARAVRSLKKKIARIREWELARERGKELSEEQVLYLAMDGTS